MGEEFLVSTGYPGYVFVGWAAGQFENDKGIKTPYANRFVLSPVSSYGAAAVGRFCGGSAPAPPASPKEQDKGRSVPRRAA